MESRGEIVSADSVDAGKFMPRRLAVKFMQVLLSRVVVCPICFLHLELPVDRSDEMYVGNVHVGA
jgi:hypothetical protein